MRKRSPGIRLRPRAVSGAALLADALDANAKLSETIAVIKAILLNTVDFIFRTPVVTRYPPSPSELVE